MNKDYYANIQARIDTVLGDKLMVQVSSCRNDWFTFARFDDGVEFDDWLLETYGLEICYADGFIAGINIADEKKYLLFVLKYA